MLGGFEQGDKLEALPLAREQIAGPTRIFETYPERRSCRFTVIPSARSVLVWTPKITGSFCCLKFKS